MMYSSIVIALIYVFLLSAIGTIVLYRVFVFLGKRGYLGNLYPNVRGGIPRAIGLVPFIILSFYLLPKFNNLVLIMGIFAFIDDVMGRKKCIPLGIEWGQLSRGIGIMIVMIVGILEGLGVSAVFIALLVQPLNISDMQPGSTCIVTIMMSVLTILIMLLINSPPTNELVAIYTPLVILVVCLGYCPLDFSGRIMLGEVGNHTFGIALGGAFYLVGGLWSLIFLGIITTALIAFVRRNTLRIFFRQNLGLLNPTFGDYFMDVLTGGGLGDLFRKFIFGDKQYSVDSPILILLGFRRLLYNPHARQTIHYRHTHMRNKEPPRLGR